MICPGCNTPHVEHAYSRTANPPCASWPRCARCGDATEPRAGARDKRDAIQVELGICSLCAMGEDRARQHAAGKVGDTLIIGGYVYGADRRNCVPLGNPDPNPRQKMRGMAGRRFDIERFDGSPPFSCYSLWAGSEVDEYCRDRMPDNARFLNGAERSKIGEITCWGPSRAPRDRDGAEGGDANAAPVPQVRQARAEGIAQNPSGETK